MSRQRGAAGGVVPSEVRRFYENRQRCGCVAWEDAAGDRLGLIGYSLYRPAEFRFRVVKWGYGGTDRRQAWTTPSRAGEAGEVELCWPVKDPRPSERFPPPPVPDGLLDDIQAGLITCVYRRGIPHPVIDRLIEHSPPEVAPLFYPGGWLDADTLSRSAG